MTLQNRRKEAGLGSTKPRSARGISGCSWLRAQLEKAGAGRWRRAEWSLLIKATEIVEISKEEHSYQASRIRISSRGNLKDSCKAFLLPNFELAAVMPSGAIRGCLPLAEPAMIFLIIRSPFRGKIPSNQSGLCLFLLHQHGGWS